VSRVGRGDLPDGIDVRGAGGIIIAPGAVLPNGKRCQSANGKPSLADAYKAGAIPELPRWLADITRPKPRLNGGAPDEDARGFVEIKGANSGSRARRGGRRTQCRPVGKRNEMLNAMALGLGRMIARGWVDERTVVDALLGACDANKFLREHGHRATMKPSRAHLNGDKDPEQYGVNIITGPGELNKQHQEK